MNKSSLKRFKKVYVEISNICNLQCSFCPEVEREKNTMSRELFEKTISTVAPLTEEVCLHLMGEPLGHPLFIEFIEICKRHEVKVNLTSNGTLLNDARSAAILNQTVAQVNFSVHSFEANFPDQDISAYLKKVFTFTKRALIERPDLYVNYRLWNLHAVGSEHTQNNSVIDRTRTNSILLKKLSEEFEVDMDSKVGEGVDVRWRKGVNIRGRFYLHFDSQFEWPHPSQKIRTEVGFCHGLSSHIGILADGTVVPCCLDKEGRIALGNCAKQNLDEILQSERAVRMQNGFQNGKLTESLCQKCTFINRFDKKAKNLAAQNIIRSTHG